MFFETREFGAPQLATHTSSSYSPGEEHCISIYVEERGTIWRHRSNQSAFGWFRRWVANGQLWEVLG